MAPTKMKFTGTIKAIWEPSAHNPLSSLTFALRPIIRKLNWVSGNIVMHPKNKNIIPYCGELKRLIPEAVSHINPETICPANPPKKADLISF